ncbi:hypothetical protein SISNIDRAFT_549600 [Sistotremastrum niveocremeum HHB9708]|uniref:Uncharacterized protein n=1 Tax=Sistotremastrum niveocremeum HHB9708 TaxID=1314777 RepID=A0A164V713_9AGAM|nr:hypothetical protein SISNIDRAFT_549600 [Sistotremastrum niveocremeum HHB9708]
MRRTLSLFKWVLISSLAAVLIYTAYLLSPPSSFSSLSSLSVSSVEGTTPERILNPFNLFRSPKSLSPANINSAAVDAVDKIDEQFFVGTSPSNMHVQKFKGRALYPKSPSASEGYRSLLSSLRSKKRSLSGSK